MDLTMWYTCGLAAEALSFAFVPSITFESSVDSNGYFTTNQVDHGSPALFYGLLVGGCIVGIIGGYQWWDAAQQLAVLKAKRFDVSLSPMPMMRTGDCVGGLALQVRWGGHG
jgi:hypothetical protein